MTAARDPLGMLVAGVPVGAVVEVARRAGAAILDVYASGESFVRAKPDDSPLTVADLRAHELIASALARIAPGVPVLSEEGAEVPWTRRRGWRRHWLVDPLDGTREFLSRNGEFTVNIALIEDTRPIFGVVHVPVRARSYWGMPGRGAWVDGTPIHVRPVPASPLRIVGSRSHRGDTLDAFLARIGAHEFVPCGSSLKFCVVAEGAADLYPRLGPTNEWDTAAGHAVLEGAGGSVSTLDGAPLAYNERPGLLNPSFIACGDSARDWPRLLRQSVGQVL